MRVMRTPYKRENWKEDGDAAKLASKRALGRERKAQTRTREVGACDPFSG